MVVMSGPHNLDQNGPKDRNESGQNVAAILGPYEKPLGATVQPYLRQTIFADWVEFIFS